MEVKAPLNFHQPGLADGSYVIFVGGRQKLCNFRLLTFIDQGPTEDKMKPTKKVFFCGFWLIFHWPMEVQQFPVVREQPLVRAEADRVRALNTVQVVPKLRADARAAGVGHVCDRAHRVDRLRRHGADRRTDVGQHEAGLSVCVHWDKYSVSVCI
jgi:hypothetical protein